MVSNQQENKNTGLHLLFMFTPRNHSFLWLLGAMLECCSKNSGLTQSEEVSAATWIGTTSADTRATSSPYNRCVLPYWAYLITYLPASQSLSVFHHGQNSVLRDFLLARFQTSFLHT